VKSLRLACVLVFAGGLLSGCQDNSTAGSSSSTPSANNAAASNNLGVATLSWLAPTTDTNGAPLSDLAGYRIYYGLSKSQLTQTVHVSTVGIQTYVLDGLTSGTWYFAVKAVTIDGAESALSDIVSKKIS
jgi:hypothetical protein